MFHKITSVSPQKNYNLIVHFWNGETKKYDVKPLFDKWPVFQNLKENGLFDEARVDIGGYAVIWNDDIDLSCDELYENGKTVKTDFDNILSFGDASKIWNLDESTLRKAVIRGRLEQGTDVCKYGKQWLVTWGAMVREYGEAEV